MTKDDRERFTFRIPKPIYQMLKDDAKARGVSLNALILQVLEEWVKNNQKRKEDKT